MTLDSHLPSRPESNRSVRSRCKRTLELGSARAADSAGRRRRLASRLPLRCLSCTPPSPAARRSSSSTRTARRTSPRPVSGSSRELAPSLGGRHACTRLTAFSNLCLPSAGTILSKIPPNNSKLTCVSLGPRRSPPRRHATDVAFASLSTQTSGSRSVLPDECMLGQNGQTDGLLAVSHSLRLGRRRCLPRPCR